jgi:hypothetical protein
MVKKETRVIVRGKQRADIAVEAVVQIVIAFGRELEARQKAKQASAEAVVPS